MKSGSMGPAWVALGAGAAALAVAASLLHRTLTVTFEIRRYADDIAGAGERVQRNTDVADVLLRLRALTAEIRAVTAGLDGAAEEVG